ncbi:TadG family pilus assembly protein [Paraburkholderia antibiotica]|uniref:DUF2134 domain-containing protein n=1 Tax=Paraburkholderia antibiotica TaxID=2728839 RepID=A0A7X9ZZB7_9BURK|nr:TadG family pilus assembly protein [Paraburkholderia antibiotica]NML32273.1 hypothetical protein [Paraburkholderia antibiotica]
MHGESPFPTPGATVTGAPRDVAVRRLRAWSREWPTARATRVVGTRRQRGSIMMLAALWLGIAVVALGAIDIGNVYFVRRELQRTADMSAMAAVQVISTPSGCTGAQNAAQLNAQANGFAVDGSTYVIKTSCGRWDTSSKTYFGTSGNPLNAAQVKVTQQVPMFFLVGPPRSVSATATAVASNIDAFSLGTAIASLNTQQSALLNAILGGLLKTSISLSVGDTQSLANAQISLDKLRVALGAASMQGLLATTVSYQKFALALVSALQAGGDTIDAAILQTLAVAVPGGQNITIGDNGTSSPGLLSLGLSNPNSAATATINALDAVMVAAQIAQSNPNGTAPVINVSAALAGVAGLSLQVINPPVLAVGEGGTNSDGTPRTVARTASVKLSLTLAALQPVDLLDLVTVSVLSTPVMVTLYVAPGTASLTSIDCEATKAATQASLQVTPGIASLCLGGSSACTGSSTVPAVNVASITLLGGTVPVAAVALPGLGPLNASPGPMTVTINGSSGSFNVTQTVNSNALGSDLSSLTTKLLAQVAAPGALSIQLLGSNLLGAVLSPALSLVTTLLTPVLQAVFSLLNTVIVPVLSLLGVQIGTATVHNMSLTCGVPQLVQ